MKSKAEICKEEGNKCMKEGKHTEAVIHYTEALRYDPNNALLFSNRSLAFLKIDQLYFALDDAAKCIKLEPSWPKGFYRRGEAELKAGNYTKALMSYRQAHLLDPSDGGISTAIAKAQKEFSLDKKDASQKPILFCIYGLLIGVLVVAADTFIAGRPVIQHPILQVLLIFVFGGIGFLIAKAHRFLTVSQREALLEEPLDLLKEMGQDSGDIPGTTPVDTKKPQRSASAQKKKKS